VGANRTEEGREGVVDERAELRAATMVAAVIWTPIWPGSGSIELEKGWWSFGAR